VCRNTKYALPVGSISSTVRRFVKIPIGPSFSPLFVLKSLNKQVADLYRNEGNLGAYRERKLEYIQTFGIGLQFSISETLGIEKEIDWLPFTDILN